MSDPTRSALEEIFEGRVGRPYVDAHLKDATNEAKRDGSQQRSPPDFSTLIRPSRTASATTCSGGKPWTERWRLAFR